MSTDYDVACETCRTHRHLGQRFASGWAFGYGTGAVDSHRRAGEFIIEHVDAGHVVRVRASESVPSDYKLEGPA